MEFECLGCEFSEGGGRGRRISSLLAENGYQSLQREGLALIQRYLPGDPGSADAPAQLERARTVDVLIPPADPTARILVCERPAADGARGTVVAVVAVGRSQETPTAAGPQSRSCWTRRAPRKWASRLGPPVTTGGHACAGSARSGSAISAWYGR